MNYNNQLTQAGVPVYSLGACRTADYESETFDFHHVDLTGATLECYISEHPDAQVRLATLVTDHVVETKSYQDFIDECRFESGWIPCGETEANNMTTSVVNISSAKSTFTDLPRAAEMGEAVTFYYVLRQSDPSEEVLMAGKFLLTETA